HRPRPLLSTAISGSAGQKVRAFARARSLLFGCPPPAAAKVPFRRRPRAEPSTRRSAVVIKDNEQGLALKHFHAAHRRSEEHTSLFRSSSTAPSSLNSDLS